MGDTGAGFRLLLDSSSQHTTCEGVADGSVACSVVTMLVAIICSLPLLSLGGIQPFLANFSLFLDSDVLNAMEIHQNCLVWFYSLLLKYSILPPTDDLFLSMREVLVGGMGGNLYSLAIEANEKKEKFFKKLYNFEDEGTEICGLSQQGLQDGNVFVMIVTNSALYALTGSSNLEEMFSVYSSSQVKIDLWPILFYISMQCMCTFKPIMYTSKNYHPYISMSFKTVGSILCRHPWIHFVNFQ